MAVKKADGFILYLHSIGRGTLLRPRLALLGRKLAAGASVNNASIAKVGGFGSMQLTAAAKAGVNDFASLELLKIAGIDCAALALKIAVAVCASIGTLVPG